MSKAKRKPLPSIAAVGYLAAFDAALPGPSAPPQGSMSAKASTSTRPPAVSGATRRISDSEVWRLAGKFAQIVWRASADGQSIVAPTWTIVTGQSHQEVQAGGWLDVVHPEDRERVGRDWADAIASQDELICEFRVLLRTGRYEWFRARGEPMRNRRGRIKGWIGITQNVDEQRRTDHALTESSARAKLIVDAARIGTLDWELADDEMDVNARGLELLGMPPGSAMTAADLDRVVDADDRIRLRRAIEAALDPAGSGNFDCVFRVHRPDRQIGWIGARGAVRFPDESESPRSVRLLAVLSDLTREMHELEDRAWLSTLVASSNDAIIALTPDGTVTHWNAAAERIFGHSATDMVGESVFRIVPPDQIEEQAVLLESARNGADISNVVTERVTKDERRLIVSLTLSPIRDANGTLMGLSAIERDITADRFRDAQLREAQKLDAIGQLAGGVAHDLNNILTAMMAGVHLAIQHGGLDARTQGRLSQVRDECYRASSVIRELLAFGRKQLVTPSVCRPGDVVRECQPMLTRLVGEDIVLDLQFGATRAMVVDRAQMIQVIVSLAVHARDSMPQGGKLTISTMDGPKNPAGESRHVIITVADTGMGVNAETRARLFEPYFTTRKLGWGTGLGLSVVHGIVAQFGGEIEVESEPGLGTTFIIKFPAVDAPAPASMSVEGTPKEMQGRETILLVEDEQVLRNQLAEALRELGYTVLEARNGYDALTVLEAHGAPVHLVLSDVVMPEMSGTALVAQLREWYPNLRVLFITGYSEEAVAGYGVVVSGTALLTKPFVIPELAARVRAVLDGPRQNTPLNTAVIPG